MGHRRFSIGRLGFRRRATVAGCLAVLAATAIGSLGGVGAVGAAVDDAPARAGAAWLAAELQAGGNRLDHLGQTDWGLTADAILAITAAEGRGNPVAAAAAQALWEGRDAFSTWDEIEGDFAGVRLAGPTAKLLLVAAGTDRPVAERAAVESQIRGLVVSSGPDAGRVADLNPHDVDTSSTFTQSLAVAALSRTEGGGPAQVANFLLAQQCPSGGFRLTPAAGSCVEDSKIDTDATSMAIQSLLVVERTTAVTDALSRAIGWLVGAQAADGSFKGTGPTATPNSNSTGLAAQALRAAGRLTAADSAAGWIAALQRPSGGSDPGAIAYDPFAAQGAADGIGNLSRDQWRRATSQAMLAFGAPVMGQIGDAESSSATTSSTSTTSSTTSTSTTSSTTSTSTTSAPSTTSTTTPALSTTTVTSPTPVEVASSTASHTVAASESALARTGAGVDQPVGLALMALGFGGLLVLYGPRRR